MEAPTLDKYGCPPMTRSNVRHHLKKYKLGYSFETKKVINGANVSYHKTAVFTKELIDKVIVCVKNTTTDKNGDNLGWRANNGTVERLEAFKDTLCV